MREILFRGKRVDNGEWVEGLFARCKVGNLILPCIQRERENDNGDYIEAIIVNGNTLGQYTGLKDKNGVKIYEGDVVSAWSQGVHAKGKIAQRIDGYWIMYPSYQENIMWYLAPDADGRTDIEIIGNIHDGASIW